MPVGEIVSAHAVLGLEMADDGFDSGSPFHLAFDLWGHAPFLARDEDPELVMGRGIVAAITLVGEDARDGVADEPFHIRDDGGQRMTIIGIAGQCLHMSNELAALGVRQGRCDRDLHTELVRFVRLAFADAFHFGGVQRVDFGAALMRLLIPYPTGEHEQLGEGPLHSLIGLDLAGDVADDAPQIGFELLQRLFGPLELLGMSVTLVCDEGELSYPRIGLAQGNPMPLRQAHQLLAGPM